jgi:hypothetical protein
MPVRDEPPELGFLRSVFVRGGDAYWAFPASVRPDGRYIVQSGRLAACYNAWRAANGLGPIGVGAVSARMAAHGAAHGIERVRSSERRAFVIDAAVLRAALGAGTA